MSMLTKQGAAKVWPKKIVHCGKDRFADGSLRQRLFQRTATGPAMTPLSAQIPIDAARSLQKPPCSGLFLTGNS
jgi:hypothetical protein